MTLAGGSDRAWLRMAVVRYQDSVDHTVEMSREGVSLLDVSLGAGLPHFHQCNRLARCTTCRVRVLERPENLSPRSGPETQIALERGWADNIRLACQARVNGDVTIARVVLEQQAALAIFPESAPEQTTEERALAVMFCDLRNFTGFAAAHLPQDVIYVLNRFFQEACEPVLDNDGYIDKYLGDGFLALFGLKKNDPAEFCLDAARAAVRIPGRIRDLNRWLKEAFNVEFDFGVGLHFGPAVVGHTGHPLKMQLTVLGDTVNVASRVEGLNKQTGTRILATSAFAAQVDGFASGGRKHYLEITRDGRRDTLHEITTQGVQDDAVRVQMSYDLARPDALVFAQKFYKRLFAMEPALAQLFRGVDLNSQYRMLMDMISRTIRLVHRPGEIAPPLRELGARHATYGVKESHYPLVGQALLDTLEEVLGPAFDARTRVAWIEMYGRISALMCEGALKPSA